MKTIITTLTLVLFSFIMNAQDNIVLTDSTIIKGIVTEINVTSVKFRKTQTGPVYVIDKTTVDHINYENGSTEFIAGKQPSIPQTSTTTSTSPTPPNSNRADPSTNSGNHLGRYNANEETSDVPVKKYGGPRVGMTIISDGIVAENIGTNVISQFGWQFETRFFTTQGGASGLFEFVPLLGGMERGVFLPSASAIIGFRGSNGIEFGCGPNLSRSGVGMVFAGGASFQMGSVCIPFNVAFQPNIVKQQTYYDPSRGYVTGKMNTGFKLSMLIGFNTRTH